MTGQRALSTPATRGAVAQPGLVLVPQPAASPLADLLALLSGAVVRLEHVDLVELANEEYLGLDPDVDVETWSAARIALDDYLYAVAEQRRVGGPRARGMHHDLCRYVLPFLLEWRVTEHEPLRVDRLKTSDLDRFAQTLAGEKPLPAATVVADMLGRDRLALTCHWLTGPEAELVTGMPWRDVTAAVPVHRDVPPCASPGCGTASGSGCTCPIGRPDGSTRVTSAGASATCATSAASSSVPRSGPGPRAASRGQSPSDGRNRASLQACCTGAWPSPPHSTG